MLRNQAVLEILGGPSDSTGVFEFSDGAELERSGERSYVVAQRGVYLSQAWDIVADTTGLPEANTTRRAGYHIDGGAGQQNRKLSFATGGEDENITWGDGSGGDGPGNVTKTDASGAGVHREDRADVFEHWVAQSATGSITPGLLHYNQWSDGTYGDVGAFEEPMPVVIDTWSFSNSLDNPSAISGDISLTRTETAPAKDLDGVVDSIDDRLADSIPDY